MCVVRLYLSQWCSASFQPVIGFPYKQKLKSQIKSRASPRNENDACMFLKSDATAKKAPKKKKAVKGTFCLYPLVSQCVKRASKQRHRWGTLQQLQMIYKSAAFWICAEHWTLRRSSIKGNENLRHHEVSWTALNWIEFRGKGFCLVHTGSWFMG